MAKEELVRDGINHFAIMKLSSNAFCVCLRNERGVLYECSLIANSLEIPLIEMIDKAIDFGGYIYSSRIRFRTRSEIERFVIDFLEPRLVLITLAGIQMEPQILR